MAQRSRSGSPRGSPKARRLRAAVAATLALGCGHKEQDATSAAVAPSASASAAASDHLAPGELVEGKEKAFGLVLPRDLRLQKSFQSVVFAWGPSNATDVSNYVRARVKDGTVSAGTVGTS